MESGFRRYSTLRALLWRVLLIFSCNPDSRNVFLVIEEGTGLESLFKSELNRCFDWCGPLPNQGFIDIAGYVPVCF